MGHIDVSGVGFSLSAGRVFFRIVSFRGWGGGKGRGGGSGMEGKGGAWLYMLFGCVGWVCVCQMWLSGVWDWRGRWEQVLRGAVHVTGGGGGGDGGEGCSSVD